MILPEQLLNVCFFHDGEMIIMCHVTCREIIRPVSNNQRANFNCKFKKQIEEGADFQWQTLIFTHLDKLQLK